MSRPAPPPEAKSRRSPPPLLKRARLSREEGKALRAEALLEAAWVLFCEVGYEKLSIELLADRAGYSRQPVYTLFGDKQNLFFELQSRATRDVIKLLFAPSRPGTPLRETLAKVAQKVAQQLNANKPTYGEQLYAVVQTIALNRPDIAAKLQAQALWTIEEIARLIRRAPLAPGEVLRSDPEVIAAHLAAQINGLTTVQYLTGRRYASAEDMEKLFMFLALENP